MYATLTGITFVILLSVIFLSTTRFMRHQIDDTVTNEIEEILTDSPSERLDALRGVVQVLARHPSGFYYLLQDSRGAVEAGNLPALDPREGVREWPKASSKARASPFSAIRGRGLKLPDAYLFVGWSTHQLLEMEEMVVRSFAWGLAGSIVLALVGGLIMSGRLMHRIETISTTSRAIIGEDLDKRLPVTRAGDELDHLADSINAMLDRIAALMNDLRQVTTDIAHDLRTPLTRLRQRLELAIRPEGADSARRTLENAVVEIDSILAIFGALLRIAQIESGNRRIGFKAVQLSDLLTTIAELYRPMAEENGQTLIEAIESPLTISGERELLMQLFANLIENALRHSPRGSTIKVAAGKDGRLVRVSVTDNGHGIPEHLRGKVLQRFYRLESSRTTVGNGLGLSLASAIVKVHDATLDLSDAGPGLRATVLLEGSG
jgi:signal transduction histidine kinase